MKLSLLKKRQKKLQKKTMKNLRRFLKKAMKNPFGKKMPAPKRKTNSKKRTKIFRKQHRELG